MSALIPAVPLSSAEVIREAAVPLAGTSGDFDPLLEWIGDASVVLLGGASHGTHEFYKARAEITKRLIVRRGFTAVAVEADWPAAFRVNRFVRGDGFESEAVDALAGFQRFPAWVWRNADVLDFAGWLRARNEPLPYEAQAGFYGLDLYSFGASIEAALFYLNRADPEAARRVRERCACFEQFGDGDLQTYEEAPDLGLSETTERETVSRMVELRREVSRFPGLEGRPGDDDYFFAVENARLLRNAELYYRSLFGDRKSAWNLRARHMAETLDNLIEHLRQRQKPKIVVWAHNAHLGDARATKMGEMGELNIGQLVRENHAADAALVGFTTYSGSVTAAPAWERPAVRSQVPAALSGSVEALFHQAGMSRFMLNLRADDDSTEILKEPLLERAIGMVYRPETEREHLYFRARVAEQFDAIIHFDESRAVEPLERKVEGMGER